MKNKRVNKLAGGGGPLLGIVSGTLSTPCHPELDSGSIQRDRKKVTLVRFRLGGRNDTHGRVAFTMAEILLSLTIIGVVAAITLPSLTGNINERTWNTQRKALYARMSQAISLMPALNGYGTLTENESGSVTADTAAETFVTDGLSKVLKINNICDSEHLQDCGVPQKVTRLDGASTIQLAKTLVGFNDRFNGTFSWNNSGVIAYNTYSQIDTKAAAFEMINGESILVYYNPYCKSINSARAYQQAQEIMCANFVYDLNGSKGPNTVGKDVGFISVLGPVDSIIVAPMPLTSNASGKALSGSVQATCKAQDSESRLPNRDEASAIFYNKYLVGIEQGDYWTSSVLSGGGVWYQAMGTGNRSPMDEPSYTAYIRCVKR